MSDLSPIGLLSFPHLFVARPPAPGAEPRYSLVLIFDKEAQASDAFKELNKNVRAVADEEWPTTKPAKMKWPFRKAEDKKEYAGYLPGSIFCTFWTKQKPQIVDNRRQEILVPGDVFAGQLARCSYRAFAFSTSGNQGVSLGLNNVQIVKRDMPRLDGRKDAKTEFDDGANGAGGGLPEDDEIPF